MVINHSFTGKPPKRRKGEAEGGGRRGRLELVSTAQQGSTLASGLPLLDPTCLARSKEGGKSCRFTHSAASLWAEIRLLVGADKMKSG